MRNAPVTRKNIDEILRFLPKFCLPDSDTTATWPEEMERDVETGVFVMPSPTYPKDVEEFYRLAGKSCWNDYDYDPAEAGEMVQSNEFIASASLAQIKTILTYCVRGECFVQGHWDAMIQQGRIGAILRRVQQLRDSDIKTTLYQRLRSAPTASAVTGSLPILFFGDLFGARVATVGINPSWREYLGKAKEELDGSRRRFQSLRSLGAATRTELTDQQAELALNSMREYFRPGGNAFSWFAGYSRVVEGMGFSYSLGTAAHLDLIQESTHPTWRYLKLADEQQSNALLERDLPFLLWQIDSFPLESIICTSRMVWQELSERLGAVVTAEGDTGKRRWKVAKAERNGRSLAIAGWNIPLANPPGLTREEQRQLGVSITAAIHGVMTADGRCD